MAVENHPNAAGTMDVSRTISTLDIEDHQTSLPESLSRRPIILHQDNGICMSMAGFTTFIVMAVALIAAIITIGACLLFRNNAKH
jgi:hypothetical protein